MVLDLSDDLNTYGCFNTASDEAFEGSADVQDNTHSTSKYVRAAVGFLSVVGIAAAVIVWSSVSTAFPATRIDPTATSHLIVGEDPRAPAGLAEMMSADFRMQGRNLEEIIQGGVTSASDKMTYEGVVDLVENVVQSLTTLSDSMKATTQQISNLEDVLDNFKETDAAMDVEMKAIYDILEGYIATHTSYAENIKSLEDHKINFEAASHEAEFEMAYGGSFDDFFGRKRV
uniref:Uncharacterized protein n=1 Tax=Fibrocapsa japonica TaxID=94617 RepID=A0A7S2UUK2_9STRA|mmetsp:Transcript_14272/g.20984  ORF Transcript_14272/g.20984 Transcript_14272/m.20984 type:complete len:230 (+) Transcript_14272:35-724(+)|eukprot:CAMPEP_0113943584 /NCGR_PEP_ID=MMETSP1339-20121228/26664_1 /TAXON_ID=94617 /ORGANISM="Fibrocapsa japonica" /LENGTH=229 /DNA_ID=CAMNT_0000948493 /DNA_START=29 /DNA_END=718 /DNA_ORIENTATION=- /assembly_acc=CAM_ASM_000762